MTLRTAWQGQAGQVRIGHFLQGNRRTLDDIWEVVEMRNPPQIQYAHTLWWRVANTTTGEQVAIPPKLVRMPVTFMLTPEELDLAERRRQPPDVPAQWPVDSDEVLLAVEKLGALEIASRNHETGEITCPSYAHVWPHMGIIDEISHLEIAHGIDVSGLRTITDTNERIVETVKTHGQLHGPKSPIMSHRGFPHRHVPEDHSFI